VLFADNKGTKDFAVEKNTKAPEGTAVGATTGGVIGGVLGWVAGIGTLAIPGVGPLVAAGPIVAALTGIGVGGTIGGIGGVLIGMGFPEFEALRRTHPKRGDSTQRALRRIQLDKKSKGNFGAHRCYGHCSEAAADWQKTDKPLPRAS
jgi:hypothetical protein